MALYDTRFGLPQGVADYLNQGLPSISGIFPPVAGINPIKPSPDDSVVGLPYYKDEPMPQPSGGDGFSPYDIRPGDSSIRTPDQYSPYAYNQAMRNTEKFGQTVGPNPDLYYAPLTGIEQLMSKIPTPLGFVKKGLDALADKLPVNRTAIFQNELLGQGIKLDNIGRIVTDNYRTPEGIMAGYNPVSGGLLNMLTGGAYGEPTQYGLENAVAERQENIKNTLQDKYGLSNEQIEDVLSEIGETGTYTGPFGFNQTMGKTTNLFTDLFNLGVFNQKQLDAKKKADIIFEQKLKEKRESDPAFIEQQKIKKAAETRRDFQQTVKDAEKKAADEFAGKGSGASGPAGGAAKKAADKKAADKKAAENQDAARGGGGGGGGFNSDNSSGYDGGNFCFDPSTPIQMADGSTKKIKNIQLGDDTKGGEVTGVFQFKASDEIHDYKGVTVAGSHYVKEDGKFIMVKDSLLSVKIDKIPVVYSLDTTGRRIFINDIEFADYNGDGIAKGFLENAGVDLAGFDKEVLRQVEHRLI
jgi:hypothetical protein